MLAGGVAAAFIQALNGGPESTIWLRLAVTLACLTFAVVVSARSSARSRPRHRGATGLMHVLIVNEYALPAGAAGITRHGDLGLELVKRGHRVTVIASRLNYLTKGGGEADPAVEIVDGVTFRWLRTGSYAGNDASRVRSMITSRCARHLLVSECVTRRTW